MVSLTELLVALGLMVAVSGDVEALLGLLLRASLAVLALFKVVDVVVGDVVEGVEGFMCKIQPQYRSLYWYRFIFCVQEK